MIQLKWPALLVAFILALVVIPDCAFGSEPDARAEALDSVIAGEFAGQEGDHAQAARRYLDAAMRSGDVSLAERATVIALMAQDVELTRQGLARWRELAPDSAGLLSVEASLALREGRLEDARRVLSELMKRPDNGWREALRAMLSSGNAEATTLVLGRILADRDLPDDLAAWLAFGGLAQRLDIAESTEQWLAALVERFPDHPRVRLLQAGQLRQQGDTGAARALVFQALGLAGEREDVHLAAAAELEALGDWAGATAVLARGPQSVETFTARASVLNRASDEEGLARLLEEAAAAVGETPDPRLLLLLGQLAEVLDRREEALSWYSRIPDGPDQSQAILRSALVLNEVGRVDEAVAQLHALQTSASESEEGVRNAFLLEGELYLSSDAPARALDAYSRGLDRLPGDIELRYARALAYERQDDIPGAEAELRSILADEPDNANALNALGYTLADRTDRFAEALELIERAMELAPDNAAIIDSMGWVLFRLNRLEESLPYLRRAFEIQADAEIAAHLGEVLWFSDRREEARETWQEGLIIDPENRVLNNTVGRLLPEILP